MCKIYNTVGSLNSVKDHLYRNNVPFDSINELILFQNNYNREKERLIGNQRTLLTDERNTLLTEILALETEIENDRHALQHTLAAEVKRLRQQYDMLAEAERTVMQEFTFGFKALFILIRIRYISWRSENILSRYAHPKDARLMQRRKRHQYLVYNLEEAILKHAALHAHDHKKRIIDEINLSIYGAIGEQKVADTLERLPEGYILINDFNCTFSKPLYDKQHRSYISSVQIDHLLISPAGIFLIETKNWSKESLQNLSLRSPVEQIRRTNFALYILLKNIAGSKLKHHHWGDRKIPVRNLIVMINHKPKEEFEFVKILTLEELVGYVGYFKSGLSREEVPEVADYLLNLKHL